jgi:hypothetical protein
MKENKHQMVLRLLLTFENAKTTRKALEMMQLLGGE